MPDIHVVEDTSLVKRTKIVIQYTCNVPPLQVHKTPINNSDTQKQMVESSFGRRFHDLKYFKVGISFIFLKCIIHFRALSQFFFCRNPSI